MNRRNPVVRLHLVRDSVNGGLQIRQWDRLDDIGPGVHDLYAGPVELDGIPEALAEARGFWRSCSGCYETEDGHPVGSYAFSTVMECPIGVGCSECGGLGAIWDATDYGTCDVDDEGAHPDDTAVDQFAAAMKAKLAAAREKGRDGWADRASTSDEFLAEQLVQHLTKGNAGTFEDVANFAMMLHQRDADPQMLAGVFCCVTAVVQPVDDAREVVASRTAVTLKRELLCDLLSDERETRIPAERKLFALLANQPLITSSAELPVQAVGQEGD